MSPEESHSPIFTWKQIANVNTDLLTKAVNELLHWLVMDSSLYSLHSLYGGKPHGRLHCWHWHQADWSSEAFWDYFTAPFIAQSPVAAALPDLCPNCHRIAHHLTSYTHRLFAYCSFIPCLSTFNMYILFLTWNYHYTLITHSELGVYDSHGAVILHNGFCYIHHVK